MSDENKNRQLTPEEAVAAARKKKVQSFKLHIDNYGIGESKAASGNASRPAQEVSASESVDDILRDIQNSALKKRPENTDKAAANGDEKVRFVPPVYVEPDLDKAKRKKEPRLETYAEKEAAIKNFAPKNSKETPDDELKRIAGLAEQKLTAEELDALATAKKASEELSADEDFISSYSDEEKKKIMDLADEEQLKAYKKSVKKRCKKKARRNGCMFKLVWLVMIVFVAVLLGMFFIRGTNDMLAISRGAGATTVATDASGVGSAAQAQKKTKASIEIPMNATLNEVTDILVENGVIKEPLFFKLYASVTKSGEPFLEGSYQIDTDMDYEAILNFLIYNSGPKETVSVRFTEGMNARQIAKLLQENGVCGMDKFLDACNSDAYDGEYEFLQEIDNTSERYYKLEGYLFPDTYTFFINDDIDNVICKFLDNFYNKIYVETKRYSGYSEEMSIKDYADLKGMSIDYVLNMASLVQAEAADEHDMYNIASIFFNRLATDATDGVTPYGDYDVNKLKSDVTVYYPYLSKDDVPEDIRDGFVSSYDTYEITNLPPGPVCSPGEKAIISVLNPASTNYYYFCHKVATDTEAAVAYYATTYSEQIQNEIKAGLRESAD